MFHLHDIGSECLSSTHRSIGCSSVLLQMAILLNKIPRPERVALVLEQPRMPEEVVGGAGIGAVR